MHFLEYNVKSLDINMFMSLQQGSGIAFFLGKRVSLPAPVSNNRMKNQFILILLLINLAGCDVFRPASRNTDNLSAGTTDQPTKQSTQPVFIQTISTESAGTSLEKSGTSGIPPFGNQAKTDIRLEQTIIMS